MTKQERWQATKRFERDKRLAIRKLPSEKVESARPSQWYVSALPKTTKVMGKQAQDRDLSSQRMFDGAGNRIPSLWKIYGTKRGSGSRLGKAEMRLSKTPYFRPLIMPEGRYWEAEGRLNGMSVLRGHLYMDAKAAEGLPYEQA